mgnify:CR=1 FL=1|jgi:hypothetical protein
MGGPTSGHHSSIVRSLHNDKNFKASSPSPARTFDNTRGASPELNSYNNIKQFMPSTNEQPRLTVLQNFKEISRIMTSTFIKQKDLESKYKKGLPKALKEVRDAETAATSHMCQIMKKMHSPRNFTSELRSFGQSV